MFGKFVTYLQRPTTVLGISTLLGTLSAVLAGKLSWVGADPALIGALVAIIIPDNSVAQHEVTQSVTSALNAAEALKKAP